MKAVVFILLFTLIAASAQAQFYYFGRNKVQWTDFDWQVLQTEHFDIYYYPEMRELAERAAAHAEESYILLAQRFNHTVLQRIPLILYSSHHYFQQTNIIPGFIPQGVGGFFEFLKGRVVIPSQGSTQQFFHVIRHELVHVFMNSKILKSLSNHRIPLDRYPPLWFTEGLAEYWSTEWDTQAEMIMKDAVLNNYVVPLTQIERIYGSFLMYKQGQAILQYIAEKHGEEAILLLMENFWRFGSFSDVMEFTIGQNYEEFDREFLYHLKKKYYPTLAAEDMPSAATKAVVKVGFNSKPVFFRHREKRWMYFLGNHSGYASIFRVDLDVPGKKGIPEPELVLEGESTDRFESFNLFQTRIDISRDTILAFITKSGEADAIHLYDLTEEKYLRSLTFPSIVDMNSLAWSPDGKRIVFNGVSKNGNSDLYLADESHGTLVQLTSDLFDDRTPVWSPDGAGILFSSDRGPGGLEGRFGLYLLDPVSGSIRSLASGDFSLHTPVWSPDGRRIAFTADVGGTQNIWVMDDPGPLGSPIIRQLTALSTAAFDPAWTDRDEIVYTSFEQFSFRIQKLDSIGRRFDKPLGIAEMALLAPAAAWETPRLEGTSIVKEFRYRGKYQLDIAQSIISTDPIFGTTGGAVIGMSDILGNDQFTFLIYNTAETRSEFLESFNLAISRTNLGRRVNYAYGIFRLAGNRYDLRDPDLYYYERTFGGYFVVSYPFSAFQRIEAGLTLANSFKDDYFGLDARRALLVSNSMAFVSDNSLWGPTGPLDGHRFKLQVAYTSDVQYSNVNYVSLIADARKYLRLSETSALALRTHYWMNEGKEARRFIMGGSWDLRGWGRWSLRGQRAWLASAELRVPFVDAIGIRFPFGGVGFNLIRGAVFLDAGSVWDQAYHRTLGSLGVGWRWNIGGVVVLRYDIGKRIEQNFSRLQDGLFYQFFFGWDF